MTANYDHNIKHNGKRVFNLPVHNVTFFFRDINESRWSTVPILAKHLKRSVSEGIRKKVMKLPVITSYN